MWKFNFLSISFSSLSHHSNPVDEVSWECQNLMVRLGQALDFPSSAAWSFVRQKRHMVDVETSAQIAASKPHWWTAMCTVWAQACWLSDDFRETLSHFQLTSLCLVRWADLANERAHYLSVKWPEISVNVTATSVAKKQIQFSHCFSHLSASRAISSWSVETQTLSKQSGQLCNAVSESPSSETSRMVWMFFSLIPLEPPRARIKAVTADVLFLIGSTQTSWTELDNVDDKLHEITRTFVSVIRIFNFTTLAEKCIFDKSQLFRIRIVELSNGGNCQLTLAIAVMTVNHDIILTSESSEKL